MDIQMCRVVARTRVFVEFDGLHLLPR